MQSVDLSFIKLLFKDQSQIYDYRTKKNLNIFGKERVDINWTKETWLHEHLRAEPTIQGKRTSGRNINDRMGGKRLLRGHEHHEDKISKISK